MFTKKEIVSIIMAILLMSLVLIFDNNIIYTENFAFYCLISTIIILVFVISKKLIAHHLDIDVKVKTWQFSRYGLKTKAYLKNPIPMGLLLPLLIVFLSSGYVKLLTFLQYDATALPAKAVKKYGSKRFSEIMEWDDAQLVFSSLFPLLALSIIASMFTGEFFSSLSKISLYYVAWNLIPFSKLEGLRLFMGSRPLYIFTLILTAIAALIVFI